MGKSFLLFPLVFAFILTSCSNGAIGRIGGADGPTAIYVSEGKKPTKYEKDDIDIVRVNGALYYETDIDYDIDGKIGVTDGNLEKSVEKYEVPQNDNECNFTGGTFYKNGTVENTLEVADGDEWVVFKQIDAKSEILNYKYCFTLESELKNDVEEKKFLVLSNEKNITFDDAECFLIGSDVDKKKDIYVLPIED